MEAERSAADLIREAQAAQGKDWPKASSIAAELRAHFPRHPAGYQIGAAAERALRRFGDANAVVEAGRRMFPDQPWPLAQHGWNLREQGSWQETAQVARDLREQFPAEKAGYHLGASAGREIGSLDEAASLAAEAMRRFPGEAWPLVEAAWCAKAMGDHSEAARLAGMIREGHPTHRVGHQLGIASARALGEIDEADTLARESEAAFPGEAWPLSERLSVCLAKGQIDLAIDLAGQMRGRFPGQVLGYRHGIGGLKLRNRLDEALALAREAAARFGDAVWFRDEAAQLEILIANRNAAGRLAEALKQAPGQAPTRVAVILGMHRSGTSLCTRIIRDLGADLGGPLMAANFANADGHYEHQEIVDLHNALLKSANSSWDAIGFVEGSGDVGVETDIAGRIRERLKAVVARQVEASGGLWAFKDPRTLRFLPMWRRIFAELGLQPVWILSVREPQAVAASLFKRDQLPVEIGELSWVEHNLEVLRHLGPDLACIVHYEDWFTAPDRPLRDLAAAIGCASQEAIAAAQGAVRLDLRHNSSATGRASLDAATRIHSWLSDRRVSGAELQSRAQQLWTEIDGLAARLRAEPDPQRSSPTGPGPFEPDPPALP